MELDFSLAQNAAPEIKVHKFHDFADDPALLRWRAFWSWEGDQSAGVEMVCYPVLKTTPTGAWIDPHAYFHGVWVTTPKAIGKRWVSDTGGQAWAKPTQQAALDSLLIRHIRWASRLYNDVARYRATLATIRELFPNRLKAAEERVDMIREGAQR